MGKALPPVLADTALILKHGGVIAYPTEAVYGFGCDPFNQKAVEKIIEIKQRDPTKGLIVIGANWSQLEPLVKSINMQALARVFATWPGPITWLFPARKLVPELICGNFPTVAIRIPSHPLARQLCEAFDGPIVSTSANLEGQPAIRDVNTVKMLFGKKLDYIVSGRVGSRLRPSEIRDAITDEVIRPG